jgi:cytochrome c2
MAASDATFRNTKSLNVVFAISSVVMLVTIAAMFAADFFRDWKVEQRLFADVEEEMAKRAALAAAPSDEHLKEIEGVEKSLQDKKAALAKAKTDLEKSIGELAARKAKAESQQQTIKATFDSVTSLYNQAVEQHEKGPQSPEAIRYRDQLDKLGEQLHQITVDVQKNQAEYDQASKAAGIPQLETEIADLEKQYKANLADFDRFLKLVTQKRWSAAETFRTLPIIDSFNSPTRIQQYTLDQLPIDYSFKFVTRYDRCTTCHLGMEKAAFDPVALAKLAEDPIHDKELRSKFEGAKKVLQARMKTGVKGLPSPKDIEPRRIDPERLTAGRVKQFAAHPRLDLFVDANSRHPAEKFGCTICHSGQGSATGFFDASHSPDNYRMHEEWAKEYEWTPNHFWDYPMLPNRFVESSCLKCHHEVTDLIHDGSKVEAPKLVKGYNLIRDLGCFGCHEISGIKSGREIGPDLRLEPQTPLDAMSPEDRAKALSDPLNPPGELRKVGPSLLRLAEKTDEEWVRKWLKSPRGFRENTKMPHFYLQPNNRPDVLPEDQKKFPDNEIHAIAHYLLTKSKENVDEIKKYHGEKPEARQADAALAAKLHGQIADADKKLADPKVKDGDKIKSEITAWQAQLAAVQEKIKQRDEMLKLAAAVSQHAVPPAGDAKRGRMLFQERGCLACHSHEGTDKPGDAVDGKTIPPIAGDATFGPDLSRVALKLKPQNGTAEDGRRWLVTWLLDPTVHNPRTYMPNVQLSPAQASDIAAWLLSQRPEWNVTDAEKVGSVDSKTLQDMAQLYLKKVLTFSEIREVLETKKGFTVGRLKQFAKDADELELGGDVTGKKDDEIIPIDDNKLMMYVGKKGITNLGCFGCHNIPGFEKAKPIGTALNDWGKKDPDRLAYEDSEHYVEHHYNIVPNLNDPKDPSKPAPDFKVKDGKKPYEEYFADMLDHHHRTREGFLHLKLTDPRSYDFGEIKNWDDRLRMPQFKFARPKRNPNETREEYEARTVHEEAEAREAVMTFILGLVAEPVPSRYVSAPTGDKLNEVKGRKVLDKFNCYGCHIVRPGSMEFKPGNYARLESHPEVYKHELPYTKDDYYHPEDIAWAGRDQAGDRLTVHGVNPPTEVKFDEDEEPSKDVKYWLMQALRFHQSGQKDGKLRDIPAGATLYLSPDMVAGSTPQYGGHFTEVLAQYLQRKDRENYGGAAKLSNAYAAAPPVLINEGEKTQPDWLYKFLLNPREIRPLTVLRMPKFSLSPDEAKAIVNYFGAADKTQNVGIGLTYPYVPIPQQQEAYLLQHTAEYVARLKSQNQYDARKKDLQPYWESALAAEKAAAEKKLQEAEDRVKAAPEAAKAEPQKQRDEAKKLVDELTDKVAKKDLSDFIRQWETREAYVADASRLVAHGNICLTCHNAAGHPGKENKGPNLDNVADRIRPDFMERWITNPTRFLHYSSIMPINFKQPARENQDAFVGASDEQIRAVRDFLMLYPQIRDWPILKARPVLGLTPAAPAAPAAGAK